MIPITIKNRNMFVIYLLFLSRKKRIKILLLHIFNNIYHVIMEFIHWARIARVLAPGRWMG